MQTTHLDGKIKSRPQGNKNLGSFTTGLRRTGLETKRDGALYVPESFKPGLPTPLIVTLHGAGGDSHHALDPFRDLADHTGSILLAPESQGQTWDVILGRFGDDVYWIDEALSDVFSLYPIDTDRLAIAGFSDGASYALSLGLMNGELFSHIMAFSPGFIATSESKDSPMIYISHGTEDKVLPIDRCSRKLVPRLEDQGFDVKYHEFNGEHTIPAEIAREAFVWFLGTEATRPVEESIVPTTQSGIEFT
jgi:phospholipase/carboxylesterase